MAAIVTSNSASTTVTPVTSISARFSSTSPTPIVAGEVLIVAAIANSGFLNVPTDTAGNTYKLLDSLSDGIASMSIWSCVATSSATDCVVTFTISIVPSLIAVSLCRISTLDFTKILNQNRAAGNTTAGVADCGNIHIYNGGNVGFLAWGTTDTNASGPLTESPVSIDLVTGSFTGGGPSIGFHFTDPNGTFLGGFVPGVSGDEEITFSSLTGGAIIFGFNIIWGISNSCNNPPSGAKGIPYTHTFLASGGTAPYTWSVTSGSLPTGLSLNAATGIVSGTPTIVNNYNFTLKALDSVGMKAFVKCSIQIVKKLAPPGHFVPRTVLKPLPWGVKTIAKSIGKDYKSNY